MAGMPTVVAVEVLFAFAEAPLRPIGLTVPAVAAPAPKAEKVPYVNASPPPEIAARRG